MPDPRRLELDELVNRPGTYLNPQTEVLVIVDDSPELDADVAELESPEGADWILISDETPVDDRRRDELLEAFAVDLQAEEDADELDADEDDELIPDADPE